LEPQAAEANAETAAPSPAPSCRQLRILVVEDNLDAAESLCMVLRVWGHHVWMVLDGPSALKQAAAVKPEVVLLDIGLPGIDGYDVARRLRSDPLTARAALIALTGYNPEPVRIEQAGFDRFFTKPVELHDLEAALREVKTEE
jgi:CheY-like chemotaxis protein